MTATQYCDRCRKSKPQEEFDKSHIVPLRVGFWCNECEREISASAEALEAKYAERYKTTPEAKTMKVMPGFRLCVACKAVAIADIDEEEICPSCLTIKHRPDDTDAKLRKARHDQLREFFS